MTIKYLIKGVLYERMGFAKNAKMFGGICGFRSIFNSISACIFRFYDIKAKKNNLAQQRDCIASPFFIFQKNAILDLFECARS